MSANFPTSQSVLNTIILIIIIIILILILIIISINSKSWQVGQGLQFVRGRERKRETIISFNWGDERLAGLLLERTRHLRILALSKILCR